MQNLFTRYRTVLLNTYNLKLFDSPCFFTAEWAVLKGVVVSLCLGLVHFLYAQAGESGLLQVDPASYTYHTAQMLICLVTALCVSGALCSLYQRPITAEQFTWISEVHSLLKLPAPVMEMTRLELATYVYRFYELDKVDQDRNHPRRYDR